MLFPLKSCFSTLPFPSCAQCCESHALRRTLGAKTRRESLEGALSVLPSLSWILSWPKQITAVWPELLGAVRMLSILVPHAHRTQRSFAPQVLQAR